MKFSDPLFASPLWAINARRLIAKIRLDRFPIPIVLVPHYYAGALWVSIQMKVQDRDSGAPMEIVWQTCIGREDDVLAKVMRAIVDVVEHEIEECFQMEEHDGQRQRPFDPHGTRTIQKKKAEEDEKFALVRGNWNVDGGH